MIRIPAHASQSMVGAMPMPTEEPCRTQCIDERTGALRNALIGGGVIGVLIGGGLALRMIYESKTYRSPY